MSLMGINTLRGLSFEQYPFLAPPTIRVTATYPGASALAVEQSVATPIEQEVNGVDRMIYMKSSNTSDGRMQLDVNFEVGVDQDTANVLTQNRVSTAQARLPQEVVQQGVTVKKQSPSILMLISLYSPAGSYDANFLINYASINVRDQILRIPGIAQVDLFGGTDYGLRIWLRPDKLAKLGMTPADVIAAIKEQNLQAPAGRIGASPAPADQAFTFTVSAPGRLVRPEEFENIILRAATTGAPVVAARRMMFSNSSGLTRRPGALTVNVNAWSAGAGDAPMRPAGAWRFCSLIAAMTSAGVMPSFASLSGRSQMRRP